MVSLAEQIDEEQVPDTSILGCILFSEGSLSPADGFILCHLDFDVAGDKGFCDIIPITIFNGCLLIAAPFAAWHRAVARRYLPQNASAKSVCVQVPVDVSVEPPPTLTEVWLWMGYMHEDLVDVASVGPSDEPGALKFGDELAEVALPTCASLFQVANEHFGFFSAPSAEEVPGAAI